MERNPRHGDPLHIAILVHSLTVFIGRQIDTQIDWLVADFARYFWDSVTTHNGLLLDGHK